MHIIGSKTSSSSEFLKSVLPEVSIIGVGKNNKFGHPSKITLDRLESIRSKIFRTDEHGEVTIMTNGNKYNVIKYINV